jgi:hypothetical protein
MEFFQPGLAYLNEEKERQRHNIHEWVAEGPPWDAVLDSGAMSVAVPSSAPAAADPAPTSADPGTEAPLAGPARDGVDDIPQTTPGLVGDGADDLASPPDRRSQRSRRR